METGKKVVIYSTPTCHFCHMAKEYFGEHNVAFTDYNVAENAEKRNEMVQKTGQLGVPVISITDEAGKESIVIGFDEPNLATLLNIQ